MTRRKAEMVLELIDRATRPARRFMSLQKRMGRTAERANRAASRSARDAERSTGNFARAARGLTRAQDTLRAGIRRTNAAIGQQTAGLRSSAGLMRTGLMGVGQAAVLAGGMYTAYSGAVSLAAGGMMAPARQFEKFETILTTTEGSAAAARKAMGWVEQFAVSTPYELDEVTAAFVQLRAYGLDPTNGLLRSLGDASAAMGKDVMQGVEAIADAVTGENERLKDLGIKASKVGKYFEYSYNVRGVDKTVRALASDRAAIQAAITGIFDEKYAGAMERLAQTFDGMVSNIMDQWSRFQRTIMGYGVFDWMKGKLKAVLDELDRLDASGELEAWAERIANHMLTGLKGLWSFGAGAAEIWQRLYPWLEMAAGALGGWRNLILAVLAIPLRGVILGAAMSLIQFAGGALLAGRYLAGIGFASAAGGALRLGGAVLGLLNPLNWVRAAFVALRVAVISTGIGALAVGLAMAGVWIYNNWSGLSAFFRGFGESFMAALGPARPLAEGAIRAVRRLWSWIGRLVAPLDASAQQWADWGRAAGRVLGETVATVIRFAQRVAGWFGRLGRVDWRSIIRLDTLQAAWNSAWAWLSAQFASLWDNVPAVNWASLLPLTGLVSAWETITAWLGQAAVLLWQGLEAIAWVNLVQLTVLQAAWSAATAWLQEVFASIWAKLPKIDWGGLVNLQGIQEAWETVTSWLGEAAAGMWNLLPEMPEWKFSLWGEEAIEDPKTLLAAAEAADRLERQFPAIDRAAQAALSNAQAAVRAMSSLLARTDYTSEGARFMQSLADGIRSKIAEAAAAAGAVTRAIQDALPRPAGLQVRLQGAAQRSAVQERARGGAFKPGWLLTGEQGPELEYRSRGGFIAHNRALRDMMAMSSAIAANASRPPAWLKGAAASAGIAAGAAAVPAAAMGTGSDAPESGSGQQYLTLRSSGGTQVSAPITITIQGSVDEKVMPDLKAEFRKLKDLLLEELDDAVHAARRREHD
ncbi:tape measure protein [Roseobacteraceae bacterium NS-SX3]